MAARPHALAIAALGLFAASPVFAETPSTSVERRLGAGVSAGVHHLGASTGRSLELAVEIAIGPAASLRLEAGELRFDELGRRDRRASAGLVLDITSPLALSGALGITPFVEGSLGFTGTETGIVGSADHDWRPHLQAGGGLRLGLGDRLSISARVQAGVQRAPEMFVIAEDAPATIVPPINNSERERYTRWQLAGLLRF